MAIADSDYNATGAVDLNDTASTNGLGENKEAVFLSDFITKFNTILAKLDDDSGLNDTDYESTLTITNTISGMGVNQGLLADLLNTIVTNFAALTAKIEADESGVGGATYDLTAIASQGRGLSGNGMHQEDLHAQLYELETNWNALLTLIDTK